eukprot:TRINITY_DN16077_c0_g1_i2.p1 TRINITY_DN16077_c0_g1~~TRINITY_DN16077_c0_g1_i2.p1  ORF type:complete len:138 (+),score=31.24 TRINITY_DN16077_c0_g1_i2:167-580(+)
MSASFELGFSTNADNVMRIAMGRASDFPRTNNITSQLEVGSRLGWSSVFTLLAEMEIPVKKSAEKVKAPPTDWHRQAASTQSPEQQSSRHLQSVCLLYTSDAADEEDSVDLCGRPIIKKKTNTNTTVTAHPRRDTTY